MSLSEIDKAVRSGNLIIGLKSVIKGLHKDIVSEIYLSRNGKVFLDKLKLITNVPINILDISSRDLGVKCKKPFNIAVLGIKAAKIKKTAGSKVSKNE